MTCMSTTEKNACFYVVHPLDDEPEEKLCPERLGPMAMTRTVKYSLLALRVYLMVMVVLAFYRVLSMAGVVGF